MNDRDMQEPGESKPIKAVKEVAAWWIMKQKRGNPRNKSKGDK